MVSILNTVRDLERLRQIVAVLVRHGFGELVARSGLSSLVSSTKGDSEAPGGHSFAQRLRLAITDLGPSFVKLGQIVSTRPDLIPEDIIAELKTLQDEVPGVEFSEIRAQVEADLGGSLEELFVEFDDKALALSLIHI